MVAAEITKNLGWVLNPGKVEYELALQWQRNLVKLRREGLARDTIILVEHPPVVTVGKDGHEQNYENPECKLFFIERGGDVTYHGPGQLVVYFIFNLMRRGRDLHDFMSRIQQGIIETLREIGIESRQGEEHTGVWIGERKIASIGVAVKNWISFHGAAINLNTQLTDFDQIKPCGLDPATMTSAAEQLGREVDMTTFGQELLRRYDRIFNTEFYEIRLEDIAEDLESQAGGYVI